MKPVIPLLMFLLLSTSAYALELPRYLQPTSEVDVNPYAFQVHLEDSPDPQVIGADIEIRDATSGSVVWYTNVREPHIHVRSTDGTFTGPLADSDRLNPGSSYIVHSRFVSASESGPTAAVTFRTQPEITYANVPVDWTVPKGYAIERIASNLSFPVAIRPAPPIYSGPNAPRFYITHLYGWISVITESGDTRIFADGLLNYAPFAPLPGAGETGVTGLWVDDDGTVWATMSYRENDVLLGKLVRFTPSSDGLSAIAQETIIDGIPSSSAHQIQMVTRGPDGKIYINTGDGDNTISPQDWYALEGKILRINDDGSIPEDNPFPDSPVWVVGLRNPFGGNWHEGALWVSNTGTDRNDTLYRLTGGEMLGWCCDTSLGAWHTWTRTVTPTQLEFDSGASGFPTSSTGALYVVASGPTYSYGPDLYGKRIIRFTPNTPFWGIEDFLIYTGKGTGAPVGMTFAEDGLYFTDLYGEDGIDTMGVSYGSIYRVHYIGQTPLQSDISLTMNEYFPQGLAVSLSCSAIDPGVYEYTYDLGNGWIETIYDGDFVYHVYDVPGTYDTSCTVRDLITGAYSSRTLRVSVDGSAPPPGDDPEGPTDPEPPQDPEDPVDPPGDITVTLAMGQWFPQGLAVALECSSDTTSATYTYDLGNGYSETLTEPSFVYHVYTEPGTYTTTCTVDTDSSVASQSITYTVG